MFSIPTADVMLENISHSVPQLISLATAIIYLLGTYIIVTNVAAMRNAALIGAGGQGTPSMWDLWKKTLIGAALIYFPSTVDVGTATIFSTSAPYAYVVTDLSPFFELYNAAFLIIKLVGVLSFGKGLYELGFGQGGSSQEKGHSGALSKGVMHMLGGIMCLNLQFTIQMIYGTLGIN